MYIKRGALDTQIIYCLSSHFYFLFVFTCFTACIRCSPVDGGHRFTNTLLSPSCAVFLEPIRVRIQETPPSSVFVTYLQLVISTDSTYTVGLPQWTISCLAASRL